MSSFFKLEVDRKTKAKWSVHFNKTHSNINVKEKSNHLEKSDK